MQPIIELKSELEGIIKLEIIKEDGTLKEAEGLNIPFYNLITDAGLNYVNGIQTIWSCMNYCRVGTSSTPPTINDTTLGSQTGSYTFSESSTPSVQSSTLPYYSSTQSVFTFSVGGVSGNLTEIGFFSSISNGVMWSRALIKDSGGNPTTLTILPTEQLKVTYTVRRYLPTSFTGSFTLNTNGTNSTINYTIMPANINLTSSPWYTGCVSQNSMYLYAYETNMLGSITSRPSGTVSSEVTGDGVDYVSGSFQRDFTLTIPISTANFVTGIGSMTFWVGSYNVVQETCGYQCSFSPKIRKTASKTLTIRLRLSWGRTTQQ